MPRLPSESYNVMKDILRHQVSEIFSQRDTNFLALNALPELLVCRGNNILDTCFQYVVKGNEGEHLLTVKVYDKIMDLFAREGSHLVGSRVAEILGSRYQLSIFNRKLSQAQHCGITRLEVSICRAALIKYRPQ